MEHGGAGVVKVCGKLALPFHFCARQGRARTTECIKYCWLPQQQKWLNFRIKKLKKNKNPDVWVLPLTYTQGQLGYSKTEFSYQGPEKC